jgi:hypothetical protein
MEEGGRRGEEEKRDERVQSSGATTVGLATVVVMRTLVADANQSKESLFAERALCALRTTHRGERVRRQSSLHAAGDSTCQWIPLGGDQPWAVHLPHLVVGTTLLS